MTFFIVLFLLLMQFLWRYIDELVGKGIEFKVIGELLVYASASLVPLALPLAILLSSLMTFGSFGEYYELTAIKSSGISLRRVMMPLIIVVILVSFGAFIFSNNVLPFTNLKMKSLLYDLRQQRPEIQITEGVFYNGLDNYSIRVEKKDPITNLLYDIKIYDHTARRGNIKVTIADSGQMKVTADRRNMVITLWNGYTYIERDESRRRKSKGFYPHEIDKFGEQRIIIAMTGFELLRSDESIFRNSYQMLNISQLKNVRDSLKRQLYTKSSQAYRSLFNNYYFRMTSTGLRSSEFNVPKTYYNTPPSTGSPVIRQTVTPGTAAANRVLTKRKPVERFASADRKNEAFINEMPKVNPRPTVRSKSDSAMLARKVMKISDFDSLYGTYDLRHKLNILKSSVNYVVMSQSVIDNNAANFTFDTKYLRRHEIELHRKFTLSFACLIFLFIGAPLGAIIRKGGLGMPTVISTLLFILYYIISMTGEKFVRESVMTGFQGMWLSSAILVVAGVFLTYQATNDSAMLNIDTYMNWIREKAGLRKGLILEKKAHITGRFELTEIPRAELQEEFSAVSNMAAGCIRSLKTDASWPVLAGKSFTHTGFFYLVEFGIHYNSFIDQVILSKWFRIPYFRKRMAEFPFFVGRISEPLLRKKLLFWIHLVFFPLALLRILHVRIKIMHIQRNLTKIMELSAGMINLLNSSALKLNAEF